jgi:hypothetical protein
MYSPNEIQILKRNKFLDLSDELIQEKSRIQEAVLKKSTPQRYHCSWQYFFLKCQISAVMP